MAESQQAEFPRVLIVDDDYIVLDLLKQTLEQQGFQVTAASNVRDALNCITSGDFDALVSDLHMPDPGDGLTVISAMRHFHPNATTILLSAFPELEVATKAILTQTDQVLVKPISVESLVATIYDRLKGLPTERRATESLANILERETTSTIEEWLSCVEGDPTVTAVYLDDDKRCAHLPQLFRDLVSRLRNPLPLGRRAPISDAATLHGLLRREQGYTAAMMVEESRMLQVSIFQTLQNNLHKVDFSKLLLGVMAIADEVDSQLSQSMASYVAESIQDALPVSA